MIGRVTTRQIDRLSFAEILRQYTGNVLQKAICESGGTVFEDYYHYKKTSKCLQFLRENTKISSELKNVLLCSK